MAIESWEAMERRHKERQGIELPEKVRTSILFQLVPEKLAEDILKHTTKWNSYTALRDHLHTIQHLRTSGTAPMIYNLEDQDGWQVLPEEEVVTEDGDLLRLERRNGKPVAVRATPPQGGTNQRRPAGRITACHACGKEGHFRRDCRSSKHKDGGPLRPPPPPRKGAGNLEEGGEQDQDVNVEVNVGMIELHALSSVESDALSSADETQAWTDWMQDAHLDPWSCAPCQKPSAFQLPTLKDLYGWKDVCAICDKAGVYAASISKQRTDHFLQPLPLSRPLSASPPPEGGRAPTTPMPKEPRRTIVLASSVPEPPEEQVLEWTPLASEMGRFNRYEQMMAGDKRSPDEAVSVTDADSVDHASAVKVASVQSEEERSHDAALSVTDADSVDHADCDPFFDCQEAEEISWLETIEINNFEKASEERKRYDQVDITMDSGAGAPVANPKDFPGCVVTDSPGSLAGQIFVGPGNEKIPNEGQFVAPMRLDDGRITQSTYQAAQVRKPLMAVSSVNDKGNLLVFDEKGSFILPGINKGLISQLRALIQKVPDKVPLHSKNGVFHMKAWKLKPGFTRQGR